MKRKTFAVLSVLAILCSVFGTLFLPTQKASALAEGWVNRSTINWTLITWSDPNTYDFTYEYVSQAPIEFPNGCKADKIGFSSFQSVTDAGGATTTTEFTRQNVMFFYGDQYYDQIKQYLIHETPQATADNPNLPCKVTRTEITGANRIKNQQNRKVVLVKTDDSTIRHLYREDIVFKKRSVGFGPENRAVYLLESDAEACKDTIIEFPADALQDNDPLPKGQAPGSATLYAVHDARLDDADNISESYVTDILPGNIQGLTCYISTPQPSEGYNDMTEKLYGLTAYRDPIVSINDDEDDFGWGSGRLVANGLKKGGGWYNGGNEKDDAYAVYIGTAEINLPEDGFVEPQTPIVQEQEAGNGVCDKINSGGLGWLFCAISQAMLDGLNAIDSIILGQMKIDTDAIFNTGPGKPGEAFRKAWSIFRGLAYAVLVILGIIMVISQILGLDFFDAYTIRKMLPKLAAAAVFIPLMWPILQFLLQMSNDAASALQSLISAPFAGSASNTITCAAGNWNLSCLPNELTFSALVVSLIAAIGIGAAFLAIGGWGVFLALIGSGLLALISAFFILAARDIVVYALVIASPLAIIAATFEPFKRGFTMWRTFLSAILLAVPAVAGVLALSKVAAKIALIANNGSNWGLVLAVICLVIGYALFWKIFKQMDKVSGQIANVASNVTGKAQKALSNYRSESRKKRLGEAVEGKRNFGGAFGWAGNRAAGLVRRGKLSGDVGAGAFGIGRTGRAKYREASRTLQARAAAGMMEQDKDRAGGDDDAMRLLARRGMDGNRFIREYAALQRRANPNMSQQEATQRARNALGLSESSLGANAGTNAMRIAAQKSLLKSNTSYRRRWVQDPTTGQWENQEMDFNTMTKQVYGDVGELVEDGLITVADGAAMIKSNGARADRAGVGFGNSMAQLDRVASNGADALDQNNPDGVSHVQAMADEVLIGTGPGQLIGQRHEAVRILAPEMLRRAQAVYERERQGGAVGIGPEFVQQIAMAAGRQDLASQLPELNSGLNADRFIGEEVGDRTVGQWMEFMRNAPDPNDRMYQEIYAARLAAAQAANPGAPPADHDATATAATRDTIQNAQRIFQEYRREYGAAWQAGQPNPGQPPGGGGVPGAIGGGGPGGA